MSQLRRSKNTNLQAILAGKLVFRPKGDKYYFHADIVLRRMLVSKMLKPNRRAETFYAQQLDYHIRVRTPQRAVDSET